MARPKTNPIIGLTKKLVTLQERNEKLQEDIKTVLDEITRELEQQSISAILDPVIPEPKPKANKKTPAKKADAVNGEPKKRGRPRKE